jgi:hypothetical protein
VSRYKSGDLLYSFFELGNNTEKYLKENTFGYNFSNKYENSILSFFGAQSVTISVKEAEDMHCFICGNLKAGLSSLKIYDVPVCSECSEKKQASYYLKNKKVKYNFPYIINPSLLSASKRNCDFCNKEYITDELFEDYGFGKNVCKDCLKIPEVNIELTNEYVKPVWRKRANT